MDLRLVVDSLGKSPLFASLAEPDRATIAGRMRRIDFEANQMIFSRGDPGREIYLVLEGRVRLSVLTADGRELSFAHAGPGNVFGEIAALDGGERTAGATAITQVVVLSLPQKATLELIEGNPKVAIATVAFLCSQLRETDLRLEAIALHRIEVRLARLLLSALRLEPQAARGSNMPLTLGISQGEVGLLIGASRPKVNAAFTLLQGMGAIARKGTMLTCDTNILQSIADME